MEKTCPTHTDADLRELQAHGNHAFPLQVYLDDMDQYHARQVPWHWHDELEFGVMLKGEVTASVTDQACVLGPGDGFFINSNVLHAMQGAGPGVVFFSLVFSPRMLCGYLGSVAEQKYVKPLLACPALKMQVLDGTAPWHTGVVASLHSIRALCAAGQIGYELGVTAALNTLWQELYTGCAGYIARPADPLAGKDDARIKLLLDFIHTNYADPISLEDIAGAANVSVSECCRCFKRALGTTPFGYLNQHRLVLAAELLRGGLSATAVFRQVGFCSQSYFGKQFKQTYGATPGQYRKGFTA